MPKTMTADEMAIRIMLGPGSARSKIAKLRALSQAVTNVLENRVTCPECGDKGPHEDNGCRGDDLAYLCRACHAQFDAASVEE